jgi:hypothetical protein
MSHLNDNVYQNIDGLLIGAKKYKNEISEVNTDTKTQTLVKNKLQKDPLEIDEKEELAIEFLRDNNVEKQNNILNKAVDKILARHRNSRVYLFMLTGPFFMLYILVKYSIKVILITYYY